MFQFEGYVLNFSRCGSYLDLMHIPRAFVSHNKHSFEHHTHKCTNWYIEWNHRNDFVTLFHFMELLIRRGWIWIILPFSFVAMNHRHIRNDVLYCAKRLRRNTGREKVSILNNEVIVTITIINEFQPLLRIRWSSGHEHEWTCLQ